MENSSALDEKILNRIPREIAFFSFILAIGALILFDTVSAVLVAAGGIAAALGFKWLNHSLTAFLLSGKSKAIRSAVLIYGLRLLLIIALFFIIIFFFSNKVIAFMAGFSSIIPIFLIEALMALSQIRRWKN